MGKSLTSLSVQRRKQSLRKQSAQAVKVKAYGLPCSTFLEEETNTREAQVLTFAKSEFYKFDCHTFFGQCCKEYPGQLKTNPKTGLSASFNRSTVIGIRDMRLKKSVRKISQSSSSSGISNACTPLPPPSKLFPGPGGSL